MSIKNFLMKKMLQAKGVPAAQIDMMMTLIEKDPELFKRIGKEIEAKVKQGMDQTTASMQVMRLHQGELQKLMQR